MEGTVTISIKEYERLKDLPHVMVNENKKLKEELELQKSLQQQVLVKYRTYYNNTYRELYWDDINYMNLEDFENEFVKIYKNEISILKESNIDYESHIEKLEKRISELESISIPKKKRFWLF